MLKHELVYRSSVAGGERRVAEKVGSDFAELHAKPCQDIAEIGSCKGLDDTAKTRTHIVRVQV